VVVLVLVVLVLEKQSVARSPTPVRFAALGGEPLWRASLALANFSPRLISPKHVKAGRSRERPIVLQLYSRAQTNRNRGSSIALGCSREPPVFARFSQISADTRFARVAGNFRSGSPLQALGTNTPCQRATLFEDEDESENEYGQRSRSCGPYHCYYYSS
jgi:hypothetical protein